MIDALVFAPGWHRKYLLLLAALAALFWSRYRLLGMLLSTLVTRQLNARASQLKLNVHVRLVLLRPLQLVHVQVSSCSDWTLLITRVTVHTCIKEFFRSFGQTKIWVLEFDDIIGDMHHLDEALLHDFAQRSRKTPPSVSQPDAMNPVGVLRFVDCRVASIRVTLRCFDAVTEFQCRTLAVSITDVLVNENRLFVQLDAASVYIRSYRTHVQDSATATDTPTPTSLPMSDTKCDRDAIIRDGVLLDCPRLRLVSELALAGHALVGVKLHGAARDDPIAAQLSTSFVEWAMHKRLDLIQRGLLPTPRATQTSSQSPSCPTCAVVRKEIADTSVSIVLVHDLDDTHAAIPLRLTLDIVSMSALIDVINESDSDSDAVAAIAACNVHVRHHALVRNVSFVLGRALQHVVVRASTLELRTTQTQPALAQLECMIGTLDIVVNPRVSTILQSLALWSDRMSAIAAVPQCVHVDTIDSHEDKASVTDATAPRRVEWSVQTQLTSWCATAVIQAKHELAEELVVHGAKTTVTTTLVRFAAPATASTPPTTFAFAIESIRVEALTPQARDKRRHCAVFVGATITVTKDTSRTAASTVNIVDATFRRVFVNMSSDKTATTTTTTDTTLMQLPYPQTQQFPVMVMADVHVVRRDKRTYRSSVDTELSVVITDARVQWNHRTHAAFLREWTAIVAMVDKVDAMLALRPVATIATDDTTTAQLPPITKTLALDVRATSTEVLLFDIRDVADVVTLQLSDSKVVHTKQSLTVQSAFECAHVALLWGGGSQSAQQPAIDVASVTCTQKVLLGPQRLLARVAVQTTVRATTMHVFMWPDRHRLLLLLLRFDELLNAKDDVLERQQEAQSSSRSNKQKAAVRQGVAFDCTQLTLELHAAASDATPTTESPASHDVVHVVMDALELKSTVTKSPSVSASMLRCLETMQQQQQPNVNEIDIAATIEQALSVDGSVTANAVALQRVGKTFASVQQLELQFAVTTIVQSPAASDATTPSSATLDRVTIFDVSGHARGCEFTTDQRVREALTSVLRAVHETFDTRERDASSTPVTGQDREAANDAAASNWRRRFAGNIDVGLQHCVVFVPCTDYSSTVSDIYGVSTSAINDSSERLVRVSIRDVALNFRQFQKLAVQLANVRVYVEVPTANDSPSLLLLSIPQLTLDAMVHWQSPCSGGSSNKQTFAVSFELRLKRRASNSSSSTATTYVPMHDEALLALNWDAIDPLLVHFATREVRSDSSSDANDSSSAHGSQLLCVGVQWDVSVDTMQVAFWDATTKNAAMLLVVNDVLSHGVAHSISTSISTSADATTTAIRSLEAVPSDSYTWTLDEATTYIDLCRAYVLRSPVRSMDDVAATTTTGIMSDALPFIATKVSNFFFELVGTSYCAIRSTSSSSVFATTSLGSGATDHAGSSFTTTKSLFCDVDGPIHDRMHDSFKPVEFQFSLFRSKRSRRAHSLVPMSSSSLLSPQTLDAVEPTPTEAPTHQPRDQTVRAKLAKLMRRSSSIDNLQLNDGSSPIQVDSMKLLWTLETRDTVFYMVALVVDSVQWIADVNAAQRTSDARADYSATNNSAPSAAAPKIHSWRPASSVLTSSDASAIPQSYTSTPQRRGSTRDTLLELLLQGKLGAKQISSSDADAGSSSTSTTSTSRRYTSSRTSSDLRAGRAIALKQYTLDIHDAQINIREETYSQSNVLAATQHIHLDVGLDESQSHSVAYVQFSTVTAHIAPIDVDLSAGVVWYAQQASTQSSSSTPPSNGLLKQVMDECSLSMTYTQVLATSATAIEVDLSFLKLSTDRHQFYQLLNVMRHVLLAPPPTLVRKQFKRQQHATTPHSHTGGSATSFSDTASEADANDVLVFPASPSVSATTTSGLAGLAGFSSRRTRAQLVEELRLREAKQRHTRTNLSALKSITFRVEGTQFRLRVSPDVVVTGGGSGASADDHEFVEIRAEGIAGCHTYFSNQCTKLTLNLQWMEVTNLRPGPSSSAFADAMAVLKAKLLVDKRFQTASGSSGSGDNSNSGINAMMPTQRGMLTVRAESGPLIRVLGTKLRVLDVLEVSVFPEVTNMIVIQLAADFYDLVSKFFFEPFATASSGGGYAHHHYTHHHHHAHHDVSSAEHALFGRKAGQMSPGVRATRAATTTPSSGCSSPSVSSQAPVRRKSITLSTGTHTSSLALDASSALPSTANAFETPTSVAGGGNDDDDTTTDGCELFYFKYVRVGNVRVRLNCTGFVVNLSDFDLDVPPYVCQSKLSTWKQLLQKFENHLKWFVTKESASSGLSHFKNKLFKWTPISSPSSASSSSSSVSAFAGPSSALLLGASPSSLALVGATSGSDKRESNHTHSNHKHKRDNHDDSAASNAQVLFGPYSGSAT